MNGELTKKYADGVMKLIDADVAPEELEKWLRTQEVGALLAIVDLMEDIRAQLAGCKQEEQ